MEHLLEIRNLSIDLSQGQKDTRRQAGGGRGPDGPQKRQNFGVVGESGCGKSITCSSIMGLLSFPLSVGAGQLHPLSAAGTAASGGTHRSLPKAELRKLRGQDISMIFQEPMTALDPDVHHRGTNSRNPAFHAV